MKPSDYKHIAMWGQMMSSHDNYIKEQQETAARMNAPARAIFLRNGQWVTFDEVTNPDAISYFVSRGMS